MARTPPGAVRYASTRRLPPHLPQANTPSAKLLRSNPAQSSSYHVSQQNTQTGRLMEAMFDEVLGKAARLAGLDVGGGAAAARERSPARGKGA